MYGLLASGEDPPVGHAVHGQQVGIGLGQKMRHGHRRVALQARAARQHQGAPLRLPAGLDEQVGKRRVGLVGARVGQHGFKARHQRQRLLGAAGVVQQHGAQFGVVFGADQHGDAGAQTLSLGLELHPVGHEARLVAPQQPRRWLGGQRDDGVFVSAAQVEKAAVAVAQQVIAPAADVIALPAAHACTVGAQRHAVAPVGQQVRRLAGVAERIDFARLEHRRAALTIGLGGQARAGAFDDLARGALVQQRFMRGHLGLGAKPAPGRIGAEHVAQRGQRHALVVRHEGLHGAESLFFRLARDGEVQRLEHAQLAARA